MTIDADDIGKKYGKTWVFKHLNFQITNAEPTAIVGPNGSGKSTLLQIISGYLTPSKGKILINGSNAIEALSPTINITTPVLELPEELNLQEFLDFHATFRSSSYSSREMMKKAGLPPNKRMIEFSSGMKQRAKLITCFYFDADAILLDEPISYLDEQGFSWYKKEVKECLQHTNIIVASNKKAEYDFCEKIICL